MAIHRRIALACVIVLCGAGLLAASPPPGNGADAAVNVTLKVASQTSLNLSACSTEAMSFGYVLPGIPKTTPEPCTITFGSSNASSMLLVYQRDQDGAAMVQDPDGTPDPDFLSGGHYVSTAEDPLAAELTWIAQNPTDPYKTYIGGSASAPDPDVEHDRNIIVRKIRQDGSLYSWFGDNGTATIPVSATNDDTSWAGVVQDDDKIVVAGSVDQTAGTNLDVAVARLDSDGDLDTGFGTNGILTWDVGGVSQWARDVDLLPDGSMLVTGISGPWNQPAQHSGFISKVLSNGTLDPSFGTNGTLMLEAAPTRYDAAYSTTILPSGKFLVSGVRDKGSGINEAFTSMRNADGSIDTTWGTAGWFVPDWGGGTVSAKLGQTVLDPITGEGFMIGYHGSPNGVIDVTRMRPNGTLDSSWGTSGTVVIDVDPTRMDIANGGLMLDRTHIMITGATSTSPPDGDWIVAQIGPDGLDPSFSTNGIAIIDNATQWDYGTALLRSYDGRIMVAGTMSDTSGVAKFGVIQYAGGDSIHNYDDERGWDDSQSYRFNANPLHGAFGSCLESTTGTNLATDGWMQDTDGKCNPDDDDPWNSVGNWPGDDNAKVIGKLDPGTASVTIRFGIKAPANFTGGTVRAPLIFEVRAPDEPTPWGG